MLEQEEIFVFGSNTQGRHGREAALTAVKLYGAIYGVGEGPQGNAYAIPTKIGAGKALWRRSLYQIRRSVKAFLIHAKYSPHLTFKVTRIGCGLAGYTDQDIAPMFAGAPPNCEFDPEWSDYGLKAWTQPPKKWTEGLNARTSAQQFSRR
jgi:hypothetical protein